ncbi:divergent polysaccharide deacetylase family protein [Alkalimonas collagenimarina]|uniref:Divergent polysaccharide deacetylase family protein n=1 Tax=Alkalimonas collagenimarina TaxID=400390 RepID=A0ABT9GVI7_9GAMM|nr:divergent polysaccharide deacetylase family protein [Alkalimonas collagenimarina]MDP4535066.1 divergent polysaccharide deacetylase family protein [Alkalimonas collagenimarina]
MQQVTRLLLCVLICLSAALQANQQKPKIAIIIDDIGYQRTDLDMVSLPYPLTIAILPFTPYGQRSAQLAFSQRKDVMLHMPMQASNNKELGPGGLTRDMNRHDFLQELDAALSDIPYAIGVNNHMGSLLTELDQPMSWLMQHLKQRQLFFVDSLTTVQSRARYQAQQHGVTNLSRHVFLDNDVSEAALQQQFDLLIRIARRHQQAIAIAHPYPETYTFLKQRLAELPELGIELVPVSSLLPKEHQVIAAGFTAPAIATLE